MKCLRGEFYGSLRNEERRARGVVTCHRQMDVANHVGEVLPRVDADFSTGVWDLPKPGVWYITGCKECVSNVYNIKQPSIPIIGENRQFLQMNRLSLRNNRLKLKSTG